MKKKPKVLLLLLVMIMTIAMCSIAFANVEIFDNSGEVIATVPDLPESITENYCILKSSSGTIDLFYGDTVSGMTFDLDSNGDISSIWFSDVERYYVSNGAWSYLGNSSGNLPAGKYPWKPLLSTFNLIERSSNSVFVSPPKATFLSVVRKLGLTEVLTQVVLLIPLVTSVVVSYLALRKALSFCLAQLRRA